MQGSRPAVRTEHAAPFGERARDARVALHLPTDVLLDRHRPSELRTRFT